MGNIVETCRLSKKFGRFLALERLNIPLEKGEIVAWLGLTNRKTNNYYIASYGSSRLYRMHFFLPDSASSNIPLQ